MPAVRNVLKHLQFEQALRERKCERNRAKHRIAKGTWCLVVKQGQDKPNYCLECAGEIIGLAEATLAQLRSTLDQTTRGQAAGSGRPGINR
jgi:hypothetical protein